MITHEREDYLKTIYKLQAETSPVRTNAIADILEVEPASVTGVIKRLADLNLVNYEPYHGVTLTQAGEKIALEVIRHHRLLELYLHEALGYSWDEVDAEAEKLEHVISEQFEDRIATMLGYPEHDPHGSPIPSKEGVLQPTPGQPLNELAPGQEGVVSAVNDDTPELLRYVAELGLKPGALIKVLSPAPVGDTVHIQIDKIDVVLGADVAGQIYVEPGSDE